MPSTNRPAELPGVTSAAQPASVTARTLKQRLSTTGLRSEVNERMRQEHGNVSDSVASGMCINVRLRLLHVFEHQRSYEVSKAF